MFAIAKFEGVETPSNEAREPHWNVLLGRDVGCVGVHGRMPRREHVKPPGLGLGSN